VTQVTKCSAGICDNDRHCSREHQADEGSMMTDLGEIKNDRTQAVFGLPFFAFEL
jgi:hypothetical protein